MIYRDPDSGPGPVGVPGDTDSTPRQVGPLGDTDSTPGSTVLTVHLDK